jgi:hypothetical protein
MVERNRQLNNSLEMPPKLPLMRRIAPNVLEGFMGPEVARRVEQRDSVSPRIWHNTLNIRGLQRRRTT